MEQKQQHTNMKHSCENVHCVILRLPTTTEVTILQYQLTQEQLYRLVYSLRRALEFFLVAAKLLLVFLCVPVQNQ